MHDFLRCNVHSAHNYHSYPRFHLLHVHCPLPHHLKVRQLNFFTTTILDLSTSHPSPSSSFSLLTPSQCLLPYPKKWWRKNMWFLVNRHPQPFHLGYHFRIFTKNIIIPILVMHRSKVLVCFFHNDFSRNPNAFWIQTFWTKIIVFYKYFTTHRTTTI